MKTSMNAALFLIGAAAATAGAADGSKVESREPSHDGWQAFSPRPEIRPEFSHETVGGKGGSLVITADHREGLDGFWRKTFPIKGGGHYRFHAVRRVENVPLPRRNAFAKIYWFDDNSKPVPQDAPVTTTFLKGSVPITGPEFPADGETDAEGRTVLTGS